MMVEERRRRRPGDETLGAYLHLNAFIYHLGAPQGSAALLA